MLRVLNNFSCKRVVQLFAPCGHHSYDDREHSMPQALHILTGDGNFDEGKNGFLIPF